MSNKIVFISYSHDSDSHRERVLGLSERLRDDGIETRLDRYVNGTPNGGWPRWMLDQLDEADFVVVICTETYYRRFRGHEVTGKGKGADWEGALITQEIYDGRSRTLKFVPVLFDREDEPFIPEPLRKLTYYVLNSDANYNDFYDFLLDQGGVEPRPLGALRTKQRGRGVPLSFAQPSDSESQKDNSATPLGAFEREFVLLASVDHERSAGVYLDKTVKGVAIALEEANPLMMRTLVLNLNVLFNRGTFRFEPLRECVTQEWGRRLLPAMETLELLRRFSSFVTDQAPESRTFEDLMDAVNGYCLAMATCLFEEPVKVAEIRDYVGTREFLSRLPKDKRWSSAAEIDDVTNARVEGPRIRAVEQMDKLRAEFVRSSQPARANRSTVGGPLRFGASPTEEEATRQSDTSGKGKPRVYISYSSRTPKLEKKAQWLADKLREAGIDSRIDWYYLKSQHGFTPPTPLPDRDAWDHWQEEQIKLADRIIVFCTPEYLAAPPNSGVDRDIRYMKADLTEGSRDPNKMIPVGLGPYSTNAQYVPPFMQGATYYDLATPQKGLVGLSDLIQRLKVEFPGERKTKRATKSVKKRASKATKKGKAPMANSPLKASQLKGKIHVAIITIRQDEYEAVEARLGDVQNVDGNNTYKFAQIQPTSGEPISVVLTRVVVQGNTSAQAAASNIIIELDPAWLFLVGIAGGVPDSEFSLGDVVLATYLHDFSLMAAKEGDITYQAGGGNMHREVERFLSTRAVGRDGKKLREMAGFSSDQELMTHPAVFPTSISNAKRYYGADSHKASVKYTISRRFPNGQRQGGPIVCQGACANGNVLLKDVALLKEWQRSARQLIHVEMELAGVYEAARTAGRESYPILAIRGISDIVGFARDPEWTSYACQTAAAYASAVLRSGLIDFSKNLPVDPK